MRKLFIILFSATCFFSCSLYNQKASFHVVNDTSYSATLISNDDVIEAPANTNFHVDALYGKYELKNENNPIVLDQSGYLLQITDMDSYNLKVINNTTDTITFTIKCEISKNYSIPGNTTDTFTIYCKVPYLSKTTNQNYKYYEAYEKIGNNNILVKYLEFYNK